ncbi:MAG: Ras family protein [Promethearchaeota archaeon CR_4]|nr:MAG: Ras family protein [Candidatus Lokiarchaeota archaeon CR_4]
MISVSDSSSLSDRLNQLKAVRIPKGNFSVKLILIGDASVGKTSVTFRFMEHHFQTNYITTLGVNILQKSQKFTNDTNLNWIIWDMGGQDSYEIYRKRFYGGAVAAFMVFDKTNPTSFTNLETKWLKEMVAANLDLKSLPVVVVANKIDLKDQIKVSTTDIAAFAHKYQFDFAETSAKTGANIEEAFQLLAYKYLQKVEFPP